MYVQRQGVNYDLLVVMNGHKALCLPLCAAVWLFGNYSLSYNKTYVKISNVRDYSYAFMSVT